MLPDQTLAKPLKIRPVGGACFSLPTGRQAGGFFDPVARRSVSWTPGEAIRAKSFQRPGNSIGWPVPGRVGRRGSSLETPCKLLILPAFFRAWTQCAIGLLACRRPTSPLIDRETRSAGPLPARVGRRQARRPIAHCASRNRNLHGVSREHPRQLTFTRALWRHD